MRRALAIPNRAGGTGGAGASALDSFRETNFSRTMLRPTRSFNVIIEKDTDGFLVATVPELRGCHTQAKSLDVLMKRIKEAIELCCFVA
jgi:hypothetical protein